MEYLGKKTNPRDAATQNDIPTTLPSPASLNIVTGDGTTTYDGSSAKSVILGMRGDGTSWGTRAADWSLYWSIENSQSAYGFKLCRLHLAQGTRMVLRIAGKRGWNMTNCGGLLQYVISGTYDNNQAGKTGAGAVGALIVGPAAETKTDSGAEESIAQLGNIRLKYISDGVYDLYFIFINPPFEYVSLSVNLKCKDSLGGYFDGVLGDRDGAITSEADVPVVDNSATGVLEPYVKILAGVDSNVASSDKLHTSRVLLANLASEAGASFDGSGDASIGVTGVLSVSHGGTGQSTANAAANSLVNALTVGASAPLDDDFYIAQFSGGGTSTTTYHRRRHSSLWNYMQGKISSVLGLTKDSYGGTANKANYLNVYAGNELNFQNYNSPSCKLYFNYRGYNADSSPNKISKYLFCDRNGMTAGVTLEAEAFTGNSATASKLLSYDNENLAESSDTGTVLSDVINHGFGVYLTQSNQDANAPGYFGNVLHMIGKGGGQLFAEWNTDRITGHLFYRSHRDNNGSGSWTEWREVAYTDDNVASATKLQTPRTIWGQSFDGSGNVSGNLDMGFASIMNVKELHTNYQNGYVIGHSYVTSDHTEEWQDDAGLYHVQYGLDGRHHNHGVYSTTLSDYFGLSLHTREGILSMQMGGNVGIGTYAPDMKLHVVGNTKTVGKAYIGDYTNGTAVIEAHDGYAMFSCDGDTYISMLGTTGKVGINTTSPDSMLTVNGGTLSVFPGDTTQYTEGIRVHAASDTWSLLMLCAADNTGSSGTSPNTWGVMNNNGTLYINRGGSSEHTGNELCCVNGNWGVGTVSPSYKLDVAGTLRATGLATLSGGVATNSVKIGDATLTWDASSGALKCDKPMYSTGNVAAGGKA